jgi:hypothetical protein
MDEKPTNELEIARKEPKNSANATGQTAEEERTGQRGATRRGSHGGAGADEEEATIVGSPQASLG